MIDKLKARQQKHKTYYDRTASNTIPQPYPGYTVRFRNPRNKWQDQRYTFPTSMHRSGNTFGKIYKEIADTFPTKENPPPQELIPEYQPIEPDNDNNITFPDDNTRAQRTKSISESFPNF